jgi:hypothetical protein
MRTVAGSVSTRLAARDDLDRLNDVARDQITAARADLTRAESRGFLYCEAVFIDSGPDGDWLYDGLLEKAHPTNGSLNWGRGQNVVGRNFFRDGELVPDESYQYPGPELEWEAHGFKCHIMFPAELAHRNGYVGIPESHPWFGIGYSQCALRCACREQWCGHRPEHLVDVHGGITYADKEADGLWYFGFDCAHLGDAPSPEFVERQASRYGLTYYRERGGHHWTLDEVRAETERMAAQVARVNPDGTLDAAPAAGVTE